MKKVIVGLLSLYVWVYASDATALHADASELEQNPQIDTSSSRQWSSISPNDDRLTHATIYDPDRDYIWQVGGTPNGQAGSNLPLVASYDCTADSWNTRHAPMPEARGWIQGAYWSGYLYIMCGLTNSQTTSNTCYIYDITRNTWSVGANCTRSTLAHGTVAYNGNIYVVGGFDSSLTQGTTNVTRYGYSSTHPADLHCDPYWSDATPLPEQFDMGGVTIIDNVIYIIGGLNRAANQAYTNVKIGTINPSDPDDITWTTGANLPTPNCINGTCAIADLNRCFMLGGFLNLSQVTNEFQQYDCTSDAFYAGATYPVTIARNHFVIGRNGTNRVYGIAGDANGNWGPPNNYYYFIGG